MGKRLLALCACCVLLSLHMVGAARAWFTSSPAPPAMSNATARIFPATRTMLPSDIRDASSGTEVAMTDPLSFVDGSYTTTTAWASTFSTSRYVSFDYTSPLPSGIPVSAVSFNLTFASTAKNTTCFYFDVRRTSTGTVIGTHGSSSSTIACATNTTMVTSSTPLAEVTTSTIANDLTIRVYASNSAVAASRIDAATVSGTGYAAFTLYQDSWTDAADSTPATTPSSVAVNGDGLYYTTASTWTTAFATTRYLKLSFPAYVPTGAVVTGATFTHAYRSDTSGVTFCYYVEVYSGTTLIGTHGSSGTPYCNATSSFLTDAITLSEVNTVTAANNLMLKVYGRSSVAHKSYHDYLGLGVTYSYG